MPRPDRPGDPGWQPLLDELEERKSWARQMGGAGKLERQHAAGRLDARERVGLLFDPGTFDEIGLLVGSRSEPPVPGDAVVAGRGLIEGRPALAWAEDFTLLGGSIGVGGTDKRFRITQLAAQERVPLVVMLDGAGHRLSDSPSGRRPNDLQGLADLSGRVPTVALVLGPSAGHGALSAMLCDFVIMTGGATMFSAGPPLVREAVGEEVTPQQLGGPEVHLEQSGVAHNPADDDESAIALARRYLERFPLNAWELPPFAASGDVGHRRLQQILELVPPDPRKPYPMREVVELVFDSGSLLELQPLYGRSVVTSLARLAGHSVAVVANDPSVMAGTIDSAAADKAARFMEVAGAFHLPVVFLADNPGVMAGTRAERDGALRHASRMFVAQRRLAVPKLHVTVRKAFGFGSTVMAMNPFDAQTVTLAFPAISLGAMPAESGGQAAGLDPESRRRLSAEQAGAALRSAHSLGYDDVIDPRDLRDALIDALRLAEGRRTGPPGPVLHPGILP